jgi:predicted anti-sigma-YlaC factor YlaD
MTPSAHELARELIALAGTEDFSHEQQTWLRAHLRECGACREYEEAAGRVVRALRSQPLAADYALVRATQMRVRSRALELQQRQERVWLVGMACVFVGLSAAITTPLLWRTFEWMGAWAGVSSAVWQVAFAFFWIVPALVVSALLLARGTHLTHNGVQQWNLIHNGAQQWR